MTTLLPITIFFILLLVPLQVIMLLEAVSTMVNDSVLGKRFQRTYAGTMLTGSILCTALSTVLLIGSLR